MNANRMMAVVVMFLWGLAGSASATTMIDLSGAVTGTSIVAPGGSFAGTFSGQTIVAGTGISGSPTNPLTLAPANNLLVSSFSGANTILPEPGNVGPLSLKLDTSATAISWTMGFGNPPSDVNVDFFAPDGSLVHAANVTILSGYNSYSFTGFGAFAGLTIYNNDDPAGLRFYNFEYESSAVPAPTTLTLLALGGGLLFAHRKLMA